MKKDIFVAGIIVLVLGIIITFSVGFYLVFIHPPSVITIEIHPMSYGAPICIVIFILWKLYLRKREIKQWKWLGDEYLDKNDY